MSSRRDVVKTLGLFAGAASGVGCAAPALAQAGTAPRVGLADLPGLSAAQSPVWVEGQGWFEAGAADTEPDGILRIEGPDGHHWQRLGMPGVLLPHWFAKPGDDGDEAKAIQRACDHAARHGPFAIELGERRYDCRSRLTIDPTRVVLRGVGATLDFAAMPEPAIREPVATIRLLRPEGAWSRDGDALVHPDGPATALAHPLALPDEGRYRVTAVIGELSGTGPFPFLSVKLLASDDRRLGGVLAIGAGPYSFEVEGGEPAATLVLESDARVRIESLSIEWHGWRECLLIQSGENSPQSGHKWIEGIAIVGPGRGTLLHGLRFETHAETRASRLDMHGVGIDGFQTGIVFSHRSYLVRGYGLRCLSEIAMQFLGGSRDAGELIAFFGGVIGGARIALLNNGAEFFLDGVSIDFVDQILVGSGTVTMQGCHLEINRPKEPDKPPFDISDGTVTMDGGIFMVSGSDFEAGNQCDVIFQLRSRAAMASMRDVTVYNLRSRSGALADGPGRLDTARIRGRRPRHMAPIIQFDPGCNLLGPLPQDLRISDAPTGAFQRFPLDGDSFKVSPEYRFVWLCGMARPGAEVGAAFEIRGDREGQVLAAIQAVRGESRAVIGDAWAVEVTRDWAAFRANTGDTHPAAPMDGRMPEGWDGVALMLDLSGYEGTAEIRSPFLCAV